MEQVLLESLQALQAAWATLLSSSGRQSIGRAADSGRSSFGAVLPSLDSLTALVSVVVASVSALWAAFVAAVAAVSPAWLPSNLGAATATGDSNNGGSGGGVLTRVSPTQLARLLVTLNSTSFAPPTC
jgi:hypothetical protein